MLIYFSVLSVLFFVDPVLSKNIGSRIVNGEKAADGQFPWQVAIMGRSSSYPSYLCSGSLLNEEWVLTAGHCLDGFISATIYSGSARLSSSNITRSQASDYILHEGFSLDNLTNDIGLIKLDKPLQFDDKTHAIALPEERLEDNILVTISGWGQISDDDTSPHSDVLNYIEVVTMDNLVCTTYFGTKIVYPGLLCTSTDMGLVRSPCLGDSGAPVIVKNPKGPVQVGIFSFVNGYGCELPYPAGNTRTAYYRSWIREKIGI